MAILGTRTADRGVDTSAFSRSITYGTSPRNLVVGPGLRTFDLSSSEAFNMPVKESHALLFRAEMFNTPQLNNPGSSFGTGTFGRVTGTGADNR